MTVLQATSLWNVTYPGTERIFPKSFPGEKVVYIQRINKSGIGFFCVPEEGRTVSSNSEGK